MSNLAKFTMLLSIGLILAAASIWLIGGKNKEYDTKVAINARASQIFPYLVDPDLKKNWMQGFEEQELIGESSIEEGSELRTVQEFNGNTAEAIGLVIRYAENEIISVKSSNNVMLLTSIFKLKEINNKTEVEYRLIVRPNGLNRFTSVFSKDQFQQEIERDLDKLVRQVESAYPNGWDPSIDNLPTAGVDAGGSESAGAPPTTRDADQLDEGGSPTNTPDKVNEGSGT